LRERGPIAARLRALVTTAALPLSLLLSSASSRPASAEPPGEDPFREEYRPPVAEEVGVGAGQLRVLGLLGGSVGLAGASGGALAARGAVELMTVAWVGLRGSGAIALPLGDGAAQTLSVRGGAVLHLLPYRSFDLALVLEAGVTALDLFRADRTVMPELLPGLALNLHLSPNVFLALESQLGWGVFARGGAGTSRLAFDNALGLGVAF
jgi:hypothetical protein